MLDSFQARLQFVALGATAAQRFGEIFDSHAGLHGGNQSGNLAVRFAELAQQGGVAGSRVDFLSAGQVFWIGQAGDPLVESGCHRVLTQVDRARVISQVYRYRTRLTQFTSVQDACCLLPAASGALHPPSTHSAEQDSAKRIRHRRFPAAHQAGTTPGLGAKTNGLRQFVGDQRFMSAAVRHDPGSLIAPPHPCLIPRSDIVRIDQDFVFLLLAPHAHTEIGRVVEDGADRRMRPASRVTVAIACRVVLARRRHTVVGEPLRNVAQARAVGVHAVDPLDDRRRRGVRFKTVQPLPKTCLGRVRVRAGINEPVTVRRSTTEISGRVLRQCRHRGAHAHLDSSALTLAHATEQSHHQVVRLRTGIDRATDLGHPQADSVVREHRESQRELRTVERPSGFPDHDGIEATVTTGDIGKQP